MKDENVHFYEDILYQPYQKSTRHPHMSNHDRAAQFAPFAALNSHHDAILETQRRTEEKKEVEEDQKQLLNEKLLVIRSQIKQHPMIALTYFQKDAHKAGGQYITCRKQLKRFDEVYKILSFCDGTTVDLEDVYAIDCVENQEEAE